MKSPLNFNEPTGGRVELQLRFANHAAVMFLALYSKMGKLPCRPPVAIRSNRYPLLRFNK
jgi:hypothetical protein